MTNKFIKSGRNYILNPWIIKHRINNKLINLHVLPFSYNEETNNILLCHVDTQTYYSAKFINNQFKEIKEI